MDLSLTIDEHRGPGRTLESSGHYVRDLTLADLELLAKAPALPAQRLKRLHDSHHSAARAIATGMKNPEVAMITGYNPTYISILKSDPTFQDLVAFYRANIDMAMSSLYEKFAAFSKDVFDELRTRFEADPESMSNPFLLELLKTMADRSGTGPRSTQININVDLAGRLEAARRKAGLPSASNTSDILMIESQV